MKKAAHNCISRLYPFAIVAGLAFPAFPASAGVNTWTTNGPAGKDIRALAIDPANPATLYAGALDGGVFKSTDSGGTWAAANTGLTTPYVNALAIDPSTSATLYAGTSGGVFKSNDSGGTWASANTGLTNLYVQALAIDPSTPTLLYAGTWGGVFKSADSGGTWTAASRGLPTPYVDVLAIDPAEPATLYAGTVGPQFFKSIDSGNTWAYVGEGPNDPWGYDSATALAISPATPATVYAGTWYGLFRSADGGQSWTTVNTDLKNTYVRALVIDASSPSTLYAGTAEMYAPRLGNGILKSIDGGTSWTAMNAGLVNPFVSALAIDPTNPARIYAGTGGGVYEYLAVELAGDRRIFPVVGSTAGTNGAFFRTSVQLHNPGSAPMAGRIVFHPSGVAGSDIDPSLSYSLAPGQTQSIADLLPAMGVSGLGSADIEITAGSAPIASARVFNDAGPSGTTGFTEQPMRAEEALLPGQTGVLLIPPDFTVARFNVGVRSLEDGASATLTLRNASGAVVGSNTRVFPPDYHEQRDAGGFLGVVEVPPGGSVSITVNSGAAIVYGATVDNRTGDPSLQIARATSP